MIIAMPALEGKLVSHFGHARYFAFATVSADGEIQDIEYKETPPHQPGLLPRWAEEHGAEVVIAGGMGRRAVALFESLGIDVVTGVAEATVEEIVKAYLKDELESTGELCGQHDQHHGDGHHGEGHQGKHGQGGSCH